MHTNTLGSAPEPAAYTIDTFCEAHGITRSFLYKLWKNGAGPKYMMLGSKRLISREEAKRWRAHLTAETNGSRVESRRSAN